MQLIPQPIRRWWRNNGHRFGRLLTLPVHAATSSLAWIGHIVRSWWVQRRFRHLLYGLPTLLVMGVSGYLATVSLLRTPTALAQTYTQAAKSAMDRQNYEAAKLFLRRVVDLDAADNDALFDLAKASQETEDFAQVATIIDRLAPADRPVHAEAHLWKAMQHVAQPGTQIEDVRAAENQLLHALSLRPDDRRVQSMLGELYFQQGAWRQAIRYFAPLATDVTSVRLPLAKAYALSGDETRGRRWGEEARDDYVRQVGEDPRRLQPRLGWADSLMFLEQYAESAKVLREGIEMQLVDDAGRMTSGLARVYTAWSDWLNSRGDEVQATQFQLLSQALLLNPNDMVILDRLLKVLRDDGATSVEVRDFLLDNIAAGRAVAVSHLILGTNAIEMSDKSTAEFHLTRGFEIAQSGPIIGNNLAWYLAFLADPPQPERALAIIQPIVERYPEDLRFVDTRGQVFTKLQRWNEALSDLERSLRTHNTTPSTHAALSEAYRELGQPELADRHEKISDDLTAQ